jgi:hypothetical protein
MNFAAEFAFATLYTNLILYKENPRSLRLSFEQEVRNRRMVGGRGSAGQCPFEASAYKYDADSLRGG